MPRKRATIRGAEEKKSQGGGIAVIIVVALILAVAYAIFNGSTEEGGAVENLLAQSELAANKITQESFTYEGTMKIALLGDDMLFPFTGEGRMDSLNKRTQIKFNIETGVSSLDSISIEAYVIGDDIYYNDGTSWFKIPGRGNWGQAHLSQKLVAIAQELDSKELKTEEMINEKAAYVIELEPSAEELIDLFGSISPALSPDIAMGTDIVKADQILENVVLTIWIDKLDFLPKKLKMEFTLNSMTFNPGGTGVAAGEVELSLIINLDQTIPFNIALPSAAREATDITA